MFTPFRDPYITTYTGGKFYYYDPERSTINIQDIAHALSNTCRFGGHVREFYSVAQHSVMVSELLGGDDEVSLHGLLHDAAEAFCCDLPSPCKARCNGEYAAMEKEAMRAIYCILSIRIPGRRALELIKYADEVALVTEARSLLQEHEWIREFGVQPLDLPVAGISPLAAEKKFLQRYEALTSERTSSVTYRGKDGKDRFYPGQGNCIRLAI